MFLTQAVLKLFRSHTCSLSAYSEPEILILMLLFQLSELLLQEPQHQQPELLVLLLQHRGRGHGAEAIQVSLYIVMTSVLYVLF